MQDAKCQGMDPDIFFPDRGGDFREATAVCARCPVAAECLDWALTWPETHGVWGGMGERGRRRIRHQRFREGDRQKRCHCCQRIWITGSTTSHICPGCRERRRLEQGDQPSFRIAQ
jgi:hypothetical protein